MARLLSNTVYVVTASRDENIRGVFDTEKKALNFIKKNDFQHSFIEEWKVNGDRVGMESVCGKELKKQIKKIKVPCYKIGQTIRIKLPARHKDAAR